MICARQKVDRRANHIPIQGLCRRTFKTFKQSLNDDDLAGETDRTMLTPGQIGQNADQSNWDNIVGGLPGVGRPRQRVADAKESGS